MSDTDSTTKGRKTPEVPAAEETGARPPNAAKLAAYLVLVALGVFSLVPFGWVLLAAFDPRASIYFRVPETWTLGNFASLFAEQGGFLLIVNSLIYTLGATAILIVVCTMGGYALSRYSFPGARGFCSGYS